MLLVMTVDGLYADWSLNPIYDLVFARVQLNLFLNAHASSILAIVAAAYYMAFLKKDGLPVAVFAAFGTASIHELSLYSVDEIAFRSTSGVNLYYGIYLLGFLSIALMISKKYHRNVLFSTALLMFIWYFALATLTYSGFVIGSTADANVPFGKSSFFYNPVTNVAEVISWLAPTSLWFLPRRWFGQKSQP